MRRRLIQRVAELTTRYGEPISIVGWSLGGIYARELAKTSPQQVRQVITLGSPFGDVSRPSNLSRMFRSVRGNPGRERINQFARALRQPPAEVPSTAIYSRSDGIVHWSACLEIETPHTDNIEVPGSHLGLGVNPLVLYAVTDRLSLPAGKWTRFERTGWRRRLYREAPYAVYEDD
jgi:pimeloyl-ACP methyl ester carboxylesterase